MSFLKKLFSFFFCRRLFGWKDAVREYPRLGQKVRLYGCKKIATYLYFKDRIYNLSDPFEDQRKWFSFEFEDCSLVHAKNQKWKKI